MNKKKIILYGGTFDPVHLGHTNVAAAASEYIQADKLIFVPAKRSPLKKTFPITSGQNRLNMISLAIANLKNSEVTDYELKGSVPSYTLDTIKHFLDEYGKHAKIYWLLGADSIDELPYWHGIKELIDLCNLSVMYRAGFDAPEFEKFKDEFGIARIKKLQQNIVPTPLIDISSTQIRKRLTTGHNLSDMLAPEVANYIKTHNLYR